MAGSGAISIMRASPPSAHASQLSAKTSGASHFGAVHRRPQPIERELGGGLAGLVAGERLLGGTIAGAKTIPSLAVESVDGTLLVPHEVAVQKGRPG